MLQLTQTDNGQISGVLSIVELNAEGKIDSVQEPVGGALDNGQITLSLHSGFAGLTLNSLAGTVHGNVITLQHVNSNGAVGACEFSRGSANEFTRYADGVRAKAESILVNRRLAGIPRASEETVQQAERWIADAQLHVQRLPGVEDGYNQIENRMRDLVRRERTLSNSVSRMQISVAVSQLNVDAMSVDVQGDAVWSHVLSSGTNLNQSFAKIISGCAVSETELREHGASEAALGGWRAACRSIATEKEKFDSGFTLVTQKMAELKTFRNDAQRRRQALVDRATELQ
ncbi:MAG: hypothetical protein JOY62_14580 [Acidobacteriaceae bacterium]|nr:hypothetical protein [Acidobacteriaceae bacterium]MBV9781186.1 hypothetical protein [Acidobacteriaceae bacterium]